MGRMLDTLRGTDRSPAAAKAGDCVVDWSLPDAEEVPFIEVGGGKKLEASPKVLAVQHPAQAHQPPHAPTMKTLPAAAPVVELASTAPLQVALEPWPAAPASAPVVSRDVVAFHDPDHAATRQYGRLLEQMLAQGDPVECPCLLLAGLRRGLGTTTVLANLAVLAARTTQRRTILVEPLDSRAARMLGQEEGPGLHEVLAGSAALDQAARATAIDGLFVLSAGKNRAETMPLTGAAAAWLLGWMRQRFDLILLEGPTLENQEMLGTLAPQADSLYLVAGAEEKHLLPRDLARNLTRQGCRLRGVLNTSLTG